MSLYVYCLSDDLSEAAFEGLTGVGRAGVQGLTRGGLAAVVSEVDDEVVAVNEENLLAHNRVNATALAHTTPLPCRFGTRTAPERLAEYAVTHAAALNAALARVRGCVEMSVKVMARGEERRAKADEAAGGLVVHDAPPESKTGAGTAFLLKKRREILGEEGAQRRAQEAAAWLASELGELARETIARLSPPEAIFLRAAHLVERARVEEYRKRLRALAAGRQDFQLLTSGPWPPYSFANIGREAEVRP